MFQIDYYVILDFEATCLENERIYPQEIIEFPSIIIDAKTNKEISRFQRYIKPIIHPKLSRFCTDLTGITQETVDNGTTFQMAMNEYNAWLLGNGLKNGNFVIVTCGDWDLQSMLPNQCWESYIENYADHFKQWINIKKTFNWFTGKRIGGLAKMMDFYKLPMEGRHHSGIDDCHNTGRLLLKMIEKGYRVRQKDVVKLKSF